MRAASPNITLVLTAQTLTRLGTGPRVRCAGGTAWALGRELRRAMVVLRATKKVLKLLPKASSMAVTSTTALGDWYINRIVVDRHPLLLLVSSSWLLQPSDSTQLEEFCRITWLP